jgi:restriction system protein
LDDLQAMDPSEFESWVQQLFRGRGYFTQNTPDGADHGVDLWVVSPQGERAIVQCKRYRGVVGESVVRDLYGVMQHEAAPRGFLVTTGNISAAAGRWAQGKPIELIDGSRLARLASGQVDPAEPLAGKEMAVDV